MFKNCDRRKHNNINLHHIDIDKSKGFSSTDTLSILLILYCKFFKILYNSMFVYLSFVFCMEFLNYLRTCYLIIKNSIDNDINNNNNNNLKIMKALL